MSINEMRILSASGILGYGFPEDSLARGMEMKPDIIGCDAGSTDAGPYYLGEGKPFVSRDACKRDTELLLKASLKAKIPLLIGSSGGAGGEAGLEFLLDIIKEIASENNLHFKLGLIHSELDKDFVKEKLRLGRITTMGYLPELTEQEIDKSEHIVGLMGAEPFVKALDMGADVVIAGRTSDTSIFAALPVKMGLNPGLAWHAAKILECGAISAEPVVGGDSILAAIKEDSFYVQPMNPNLRHTVLSVAAHSLYENGDPVYLYEPGGMLDLSNSKYEQYDERTVKVWGSRFIQDEVYRIKLESAAKLGYRSIAVMGIRDPILIKQMDKYLDIVKDTVSTKVKDAFKGKVKDSDYILNFRIYGQNAVMGSIEPVKKPESHELGLILEVIAGTQELSMSILALARAFSIHNHFPGRLCISGNMAIAFSPSDIPMGPVYKFNMEHLMELDDPLEAAKIEVISI